jgi:hypothetical protein
MSQMLRPVDRNFGQSVVDLRRGMVVRSSKFVLAGSSENRYSPRLHGKGEWSDAKLIGGSTRHRGG